MSCREMDIRHSYIELLHIEGMLFDELAAWFDGVAHEHSKNLIGGGSVFHADLKQRAFFRVHAGVPEFFRIHFAQSLEPRQREALFAHLTQLN